MGILTEKEKLKVKLTGDFTKDREFLMRESEKLAAEGNIDGANSAAELILDIMPESQKAEFSKFMYVDGKRLDIFYNEILALIKENRNDEARIMSEILYKKIVDVYKEDDKSKFVCLRNAFEENIYQLICKPTKVLNKAPFDFTRYITTYGYLLVDGHKTLDAVDVLKKAIEYNPVDCGPKFELAEAYKLMRNTDELLKITIDTLKTASSPYALSRCYCNLGFYCVEIEEFDDAAVFYYTSLIFAPHPAVEGELANISQITRKKLNKPTKEETDAIFKKYGITYGADEMVISIAAQLANLYISQNNIKEALYCLKILYGVTNDPDIKALILKYEPDADEKINARMMKKMDEQMAEE